MRRASETNIPDSSHLPTSSPSLTPSHVSGRYVAGLATGSPLSVSLVGEPERRGQG